jgi:hypothetical protein
MASMALGAAASDLGLGSVDLFGPASSERISEEERLRRAVELARQRLGSQLGGSGTDLAGLGPASLSLFKGFQL